MCGYSRYMSANRNIYIYIYIYIFMSKIISVADDVYASLKKLKGKKYSYSQVIRSLFKKQSNVDYVLSFAGKGGVDEKAIEDVQEAWKQWGSA